MSDVKTSEQILAVAHELLVSEGLGAVSFDAIARRIGRSKQAVLYWFPNKQELMAAMFVPWLAAEADVAVSAVVNAQSRSAAIDAFVRAIAQFHFSDLDRFRMMYLLPQTIKQNARFLDKEKITEQVHPVTRKIYDALVAHLEADGLAARREAVAIHSAILGVVLMVALTDSAHDPLLHSELELVDALIGSLV